MVIGLVAAGWISLMVTAVAFCRIAGHADDATATAFLDRDAMRGERGRRASAPAASRPRPVLFPH
ncbi:MAG: hypothetical protein M3065_20910 [Actinomycetota bacterium]|nr:hypothetical protein [Actinomycetota bacterium]